MFSGGRGQWLVLDLTTGEFLDVVPDSDWGAWGAPVPVGSTLAYPSEGSIHLLDGIGEVPEGVVLSGLYGELIAGPPLDG